MESLNATKHTPTTKFLLGFGLSIVATVIIYCILNWKNLSPAPTPSTLDGKSDEKSGGGDVKASSMRAYNVSNNAAVVTNPIVTDANGNLINNPSIEIYNYSALTDLRNPNGRMKINASGIMFGGDNNNTISVTGATGTKSDIVAGSIGVGIWNHEKLPGKGLDIVGYGDGVDHKTRKIKLWGDTLIDRGLIVNDSVDNTEDFIKNPNGALRINQHGIMFGGANSTGKEVNSGQISVGLHGGGGNLDIVGVGSSPAKPTDPVPERQVRLWDKVRADKFQIGDKWVLSGVGDAHGNDGWLRMFKADGSGYTGGIAMNNLWIGDTIYGANKKVNIAGQLCVGNACIDETTLTRLLATPAYAKQPMLFTGNSLTPKTDPDVAAKVAADTYAAAAAKAASTTGHLKSVVDAAATIAKTAADTAAKAAADAKAINRNGYEIQPSSMTLLANKTYFIRFEYSCYSGRVGGYKLTLNIAKSPTGASLVAETGAKTCSFGINQINTHYTPPPICFTVKVTEAGDYKAYLQVDKDGIIADILDPYTLLVQEVTI